MLRKISTILCSVIFFATAAQAGTQAWNFDADTAGAIAKGFSNESGKWEVMADATAPSQPNVLAQTARSSGSTFNLTLLLGNNYGDVDISVAMKAVAGSEDRGGGLVWRAKDTKNYYIVRYNPLEDNYRLYKVENGKREQMKSADIKHGEGWHNLRAVMKGDRIECYYDGRKYIEASDTTFKGPGRVGLWTKADAQSNFDDFTVISGE
jgi:hypothetical protein